MVNFCRSSLQKEEAFAAIDLAPGDFLIATHRSKGQRQRSLRCHREREVLEAFVVGQAIKVIAFLGLGIRAIEVHRTRILQRPGARHLAQAIAHAVLAQQAESVSATSFQFRDTHYESSRS